LSYIITSILDFDATLYVARKLGAGPFGIYSLVLAVVSWVVIAAIMDVPAAISKRVSESDDDDGQVVSVHAVA